MSTEEKFLAAVNVIDSLPSDGTFQPSDDLMLKLYAFYMQATEGPCRTVKPSIWYYSERMKWNAWNELGNMEREVAMEKYVEELTKVIETMSYSEKVSRFMSLLGPFYEVVPPEEIDVSPEKSSKKMPTEYFYPIKKLDDLQSAKSVNFSKESISDDVSRCSSHNIHSRSLKQCKYDISDGCQKSKCIPRQCVIDLFKAKTNLKHQPFGSHQDILILTLINLQNSLEEIAQKLDNLQSLAKSADFSNNVEDGMEASSEWNLGFSGTTVALLWPIAVHLCAKNF